MEKMHKLYVIPMKYGSYSDEHLYINVKEKTSLDRERADIFNQEIKFLPRNSYDTTTEERDAMRNFVENNQFSTKFSYCPIYKYAKAVYENIYNDSMLKSIGNAIFNDFKQTYMLYVVFYWVTNMSPIGVHNFTLSYARESMNWAWHNIGNWKA